VRFLIKLSPAFLICTFLFLPSTAQADSVLINDGSVRAGFSSMVFSFGNTGQGFAVSNVGSLTDGGGLSRCSPCAAGQTISINSSFAGEYGLGYGAATVGGVNYSRVYYTGRIRFAANLITIPFDNSPLVTITVPFTMSGFIDGYATQAVNTPPIFDMEINGHGLATLVLSSYFVPGFGQLYDFRSVTYDFSPAATTPEPTTLLLFGTGLAAVTARYRRRRKGQIKQ
jgi:hypothetical protein